MNWANGLLRVSRSIRWSEDLALHHYPSKPPVGAMHYSCHCRIRTPMNMFFESTLLPRQNPLQTFQSIQVSIKSSLHLLPPPLPNILTASPPFPSILLPLPPHPSLQHPFRPLLITHETPIRAHAPPEITPLLATLTKLPVPVKRGELPAKGGAVECCVEGCTAGDGRGVDVRGGYEGRI